MSDITLAHVFNEIFDYPSCQILKHIPDIKCPRTQKHNFSARISQTNLTLFNERLTEANSITLQNNFNSVSDIIRYS